MRRALIQKGRSMYLSDQSELKTEKLKNKEEKQRNRNLKSVFIFLMLLSPYWLTTTIYLIELDIIVISIHRGQSGKVKRREDKERIIFIV